MVQLKGRWLVAALALAACHDVERQEITVLDAPPLPFEVSDHRIQLTEGTAIVLRITLVDAHGYAFPPDEITWSSSGPAASILGISLSDNVYVVSGEAEGSVTLTGEGDAFASPSRIVVDVVPQ